MRLGYKIVLYDKERKHAWSLFKPEIKVLLNIGHRRICTTGKFHLGNSKQYCLDYFAAEDEDDRTELLLTYEYKLEDVVSGDPDFDNGEITIRLGVLRGIEVIRDFKLYPFEEQT